MGYKRPAAYIGASGGGVSLRAGEKGLLYQAEVQDLTALRSVRVCKLDELEVEA